MLPVGYVAHYELMNDMTILYSLLTMWQHYEENGKHVLPFRKPIRMAWKILVAVKRSKCNLKKKKLLLDNNFEVSEIVLFVCNIRRLLVYQNANIDFSCRIPLNVRDIVYCTGVSLMDEDVWEFIWMKFHSTTAVSEKKILLEALTCSDDRNLLNR